MYRLLSLPIRLYSLVFLYFGSTSRLFYSRRSNYPYGTSSAVYSSIPCNSLILYRTDTLSPIVIPSIVTIGVTTHTIAVTSVTIVIIPSSGAFVNNPNVFWENTNVFISYLIAVITQIKNATSSTPKVNTVIPVFITVSIVISFLRFCCSMCDYSP